MKQLLLSLCAFLFCAHRPAAQPRSAQDSIRFLLDTTIGIMKKKALHADRVPWRKLQRQLYRQTRELGSVKAAGFAFTRLYDALGDAHGAFFYKDTVFRGSLPVRNAGKINAVTDAELRKGPRLATKLLPGNIAYIRIPFVSVQDSAAVSAYANRLNDSLLSLMNSGAKTVIIDLRLNQGGNMYPMIAGLRGLFGDGSVSESYTYEFGDKNGSPVLFRHDSLITDYYKIRLQKRGDFRSVPVAVLIGPSTASAGECTAAALTYRGPTVLIGEESMGLTNGNDGFLLMPPDIGFNLAVGELKDGKGRRLEEVIKPDITVAGGDDFSDLLSDRKVHAAIGWLRSQGQ